MIYLTRNSRCRSSRYRTPASQRVADVVEAVRQHPSAVVVADGDAALATVLAGAVVPIRRAVVDLGGFDADSDPAYLARLYVPGLRRAGGLRMARSAWRGELIVRAAAPPDEIASLVRK